MKEVNYKQGATTVWSDGEKLIIKNPHRKDYIKDNVEQIFGMGEYDKIYDVKYSEDIKKGVVNPLSVSVEIISPYIPERVKNDLMEKSLPGTKESDYGEYFK